MRSAAWRTEAGTHRALVCAVCAVLLVAAGFAVAVVPRALAAAVQEEPPPTTAPAPDPAPDPAPPVKPKPKPKPRPAPAPAQRQSRPAPAPQPTYPAPRVQTQKPAVKPVRKKLAVKQVRKKLAVKPVRKATKKVQNKAPVKPKRATPTIEPVGGALGASVSLRNPAQASFGKAFDFSALLIVLGLSIAIACFAAAVIPATHVPWRSAAIFVSERQVDLTVLGFALLMATVFTLFWVKGP